MMHAMQLQLTRRRFTLLLASALVVMFGTAACGVRQGMENIEKARETEKQVEEKQKKLEKKLQEGYQKAEEGQ
jgi:hypothetical protein